MLTWFLCDLKTGTVLTDLPLRPTGTVERTVGKASSLPVSLDVHDPSCPANWAELIEARRAMFVLDDNGYPLIGYVIDTDSAGLPAATWNLLSLESIPDASYCRTHDFSEGVDDEAFVAQTLLSDVIAAPLSTPGSFGFNVVSTPTGKSADHSYAFEEDRLVGSALNDLAAAEGGPEWTIRLAWDDPIRRQRIVKTIYIAPRIGNVLPSVVIENKHMQERIRNTSAARGDLATHVIATSDGSGPGRPMSAAYVDQAALDAGIPQWEARVPVSAVDDDAQLDRVAAAGLVRRRRGIRTWETKLSPRARGCPRVGRDFDAGDTVTIQSVPTDHDPLSWFGPARIIGWRGEVDLSGDWSAFTPVFWDPREEGTG